MASTIKFSKKSTVKICRYKCAVVSPKKFLRISKTKNIVRSKYKTPKLGSNSLGKFVVFYE